jgi:hypothetical protein
MTELLEPSPTSLHHAPHISRLNLKEINVITLTTPSKDQTLELNFLIVPLVTDVSVVTPATLRASKIFTPKLKQDIKDMNKDAITRANKLLHNKLRQRVTEKITKHRGTEEGEGREFIPFVISHAGVWTGEAERLTKEIEARSLPIIPSTLALPLSTMFLRMIAITIQKGNGNVMREGLILAAKTSQQY